MNHADGSRSAIATRSCYVSRGTATPTLLDCKSPVLQSLVVSLLVRERQQYGGMLSAFLVSIEGRRSHSGEGAEVVDQDQSLLKALRTKGHHHPGERVKVFDQHQNFLDAIRSRKARNAVIDSILLRPPIPGARLSPSRKNLAEEKFHNEEIIADLEAQDAQLRRREELRDRQRFPKVASKPAARENPAAVFLEDRASQRIQVGEWAAKRLEELKMINGFALARTATEQTIRATFPGLLVWRDVVDQLSPTKKENFFGQISRRRWRHWELFELMADSRWMKGPTVYDYYKEYRAASGLARKRKPLKRKPSNPIRSRTPKHSKNHS